VQKRSDLEPSNGERVTLGRLGDFVGFRLRRIQNQLSREFAGETQRYGLRHGEFSALAIIAANPGLSQMMLAREVGLDKSAAVSVIDDLERLGFAERRRLPTDRRRYALYATPAGEAALAAMFEKLESVEHDALDALDPSELHLLNTLLDRIYRATFHG
jgi:DNA-binding MarR family transcriptional regulator